MVSRWACAGNGGSHVVITVVFDDCRSVTVVANIGGIVFVRRQRPVNFLGVSNGDRFVVNREGNDWRSRRNAWCWWRKQCNFSK